MGRGGKKVVVNDDVEFLEVAVGDMAGTSRGGYGKVST